jgi:hypothetical protein
VRGRRFKLVIGVVWYDSALGGLRIVTWNYKRRIKHKKRLEDEAIMISENFLTDHDGFVF